VVLNLWNISGCISKSNRSVYGVFTGHLIALTEDSTVKAVEKLRMK